MNRFISSSALRAKLPISLPLSGGGGSNSDSRKLKWSIDMMLCDAYSPTTGWNGGSRPNSHSLQLALPHVPQGMSVEGASKAVPPGQSVPCGTRATVPDARPAGCGCFGTSTRVACTRVQAADGLSLAREQHDTPGTRFFRS